MSCHREFLISLRSEMQCKNASRSSREGFDGIKTPLETYSKKESLFL